MSRHLIKVILGFCGMIILGLALLVFIDSFRTKTKTTSQAQSSQPQQSPSGKLPPVKNFPK